MCIGLYWSHLEHNAIVFGNKYVPHNQPLGLHGAFSHMHLTLYVPFVVYDGAEVALTAEQEEIATYFATVRCLSLLL